MNCRKCQQELEEGLPFCPACGTDNSVEEKPRKPLWKPIVALVCLVAVVAGIAAMILLGGSFGEPGGVSSIANYSKGNAEVLADADVVVARAGDLELTNGELQIIYWSMVYDFLGTYGDYVYYYGLMDYSKSLSAQYYNKDAGITWQQYFLDMALQSWVRYEVLCQEAAKAGVSMSEGVKSYLDNLYTTVESQLKDYNFDTVEDMIRNDFGAAGTYENYLRYMQIYYYGNEYYSTLFGKLEYTDAELEAYYSENEENLTSAGYSKENGRMVDVRHILIKPNDDESVTAYTDEEWATAYAAAALLYNEWQRGEATEESFAELAKEYSDCPSSAQGGLLEEIVKGKMVKEFENWCLDSSRQTGDCELVQTEFGYHIVYFCHGVDLWREACQYYLAVDAMEELVNGWEEHYPLEVAYSKIALAEVPLA